MITKVLLLTLIAIVFYFIIQSVRDGFQNADCQFKYTGTNFEDCLSICKSSDSVNCNETKCRRNCGLSTECNDKTSNSCSLDKCNWSRAKNICEVPGEKYYISDNDNLIYRNNILFSNIDEEEGNYKIVRKPTKFKDAIQMYRFKGRSYNSRNGFNNSFIYVSDFYAERMMTTFFFEFVDNPDNFEAIPLVFAQNWNLTLVKKAVNNFKIVLKSEKFGDKPFPDKEYKMSVEPGLLYYLGFLVKNNTATLIVLNTGDTKTKITEPGMVVDNFLYGRTPFLLVGTDLNRRKYFDGFLGEFTVTRDATDIIDLKANSYFFSDKQIDAIKLDTRSGDTNLLSIQDVSVPSKIDFVGKIINNSLVLYWNRPETGSTFLEYYIIVVKNIESNKKFYLFIENNKCRDCIYKVPNLEKDVEYHIGITGFNSNGLGKELNYLPVKIQGTTTPIGSQVLLNNKPDMISCNPDGTYTIGKDCEAMKQERIVSNLSDEEYRDVMNNLNEKINLDMNFKI